MMNRKKSKKFGLTEMQIQMLDWEKFFDTIDEIFDAKEEHQTHDLLLKMYEIILQFGFDKRIIDEMNAEFCDRINHTLRYYNINEEIELTTEDLKRQFTSTNGRSESENLANIMYLANVIAKILMNNQEDITNFNPKINVQDFTNFFFEIKKECLQRLIEIRKLHDNKDSQDNKKDNNQDDKLMVQYIEPDFIDADQDGFFYIAIPGYFEPFVVQCRGMGNAELKWNTDVIPFYETDKNNFIEYNMSHFPMKIDPKKEKAIDSYLEKTNSRFDKDDRYCVRGVRAFRMIQMQFDPLLERYYNQKQELRTLQKQINRLEKTLARRYVYGRIEKEEELAKLKKQQTDIKNKIGGFNEK